MLVCERALCPAYAREHLDDALWSEMAPLLAEHFAEAGECADVALDPDRAAYDAAERFGVLRIYTARLGRDLIGYLAAVVGPSLHHAGRWQAITDVLFVRKPERPTMAGLGLILSARQALSEEGVTWFTVGCRTGDGLDFGSLLTRLGFTPTHTNWTATLDTHSDPKGT